MCIRGVIASAVKSILARAASGIKHFQDIFWNFYVPRRVSGAGGSRGIGRWNHGGCRGGVCRWCCHTGGAVSRSCAGGGANREGARSVRVLPHNGEQLFWRHVFARHDGASCESVVCWRRGGDNGVCPGRRRQAIFRSRQGECCCSVFHVSGVAGFSRADPRARAYNKDRVLLCGSPLRSPLAVRTAYHRRFNVSSYLVPRLAVRDGLRRLPIPASALPCLGPPGAYQKNLLYPTFPLDTPLPLRHSSPCRGAVAQLGERLNGIQEVVSSILSSSTKKANEAGRLGDNLTGLFYGNSSDLFRWLWCGGGGVAVV